MDSLEQFISALSNHEKWLIGQTQGARLKIEDTSFSDFELSDHTMSESILPGCSFTDVNFNSIDFYSSNLASCIFTNCSFRNCQIPKSLLDYAEITYCHFEKCTFQKSSFYDVRIQNATFIDCDLTGIRMIDSHIHDTRFSTIALKNAILSGTELRKTTFENIHNWENLRVENITIEEDHESRKLNTMEFLKWLKIQ